MTGSRWTAPRVRLLAAVVAVVGAAGIPFAGTNTPLDQTPPQPRLFEVAFFAAALPAGLTPPTVGTELHFASMIAADVDGDGDLDVVASDGSVNLIVWTNDGTGHLTRKYPSPQSGGWLGEAPTPALGDQPATSVGVAQSRGQSLRVSASVGKTACHPSGWRVESIDSAPRPMFLPVRIPRGPPLTIFTA